MSANDRGIVSEPDDKHRVHLGQPAERARFALRGTSQTFDTTRVAIRPDLADVAVADLHFAPHYAAPSIQTVVDGATAHAEPDASSDAVCDLRKGAAFAMLDLTGGWAWGYCVASHRVGYVRAETLDIPLVATHRAGDGGAVLTTAEGTEHAFPPGTILAGTVDSATDRLNTAHGWIACRDLQPIR